MYRICNPNQAEAQSINPPCAHFKIKMIRAPAVQRLIGISIHSSWVTPCLHLVLIMICSEELVQWNNLKHARNNLMNLDGAQVSWFVVELANFFSYFDLIVGLVNLMVR